MRERPILFSAPMVRALMREENPKTHTRRIVKVQPVGGDTIVSKGMEPGWMVGQLRDSENAWRDLRCPYGQPGERLWVRERMRVLDIAAPTGVQAIRVQYEADQATSDWILWPDRLKGRPQVCKCLSYGGFREASRLTLEVTGVRVERLQDITAEDARAEGLAAITKDGKLVKYGIPDRDGLPGTDNHGWPWSDWDANPRMAYRTLWTKINGPGSWEANPWVWVVGVRRLAKDSK